MRPALVVKVQLVTWLVVAVSGASVAPTPSLSALLGRHVPILVLHPVERFRPVPVDGFLADSDLFRRTPTGWEPFAGALPAGGADLRLDQRSCRAIDGVLAISCYADAQAVRGSPAVVYGAAFRAGNRIALQYWLWYPFNLYSPTVPPGDLWQAHEGDWESVSLLLDVTGKPLVVGLSRHSEGARRAWPAAPKRGARPLVHVALGSHANYFGPGQHQLDPRSIDPTLIRIIEAYGAPSVDIAGRGRVVRPKLIRISATTPSWMAFAGTWGEDAYVHFPGNEPLRYGDGPRGPAFHEQWRRPVADLLSWPRG